MKINKEKINEINKEYELFGTYDKEIDILNKLKEQKLKDIIGLLHQTKLLKLIKEIDEVKSAQFGIWKDAEFKGWMEIELIVFTKMESEQFEIYEKWMDYENVVRNKIYTILDEYPNLSDFIMVGIGE